jgi:hypothetical protein
MTNCARERERVRVNGSPICVRGVGTVCERCGVRVPESVLGGREDKRGVADGEARRDERPQGLELDVVHELRVLRDVGHHQWLVERLTE